MINLNHLFVRFARKDLVANIVMTDIKWYIQEKSRLFVIVVVLLVIVKIFEHIREVLMRVLNDHLETEIEP